MGILSAFRFAFQNVFFTPLLYGVIASLAIFSASWEKADRLKDQLTDPFRSQKDTFDFIVVGGGSAGAVLANRLSKFHTVLLLEAGGESHPFQAIPALSLFIPGYPATDWSYKSVKQSDTCLACKDKRWSYSAGRNLGGSGNLNYLIHLRGSPKDFDNWARITGDRRWSYDHVKPQFIKAENFMGTTTDESAHGVGGPLTVEMPSEIGLGNEWNWAGQELGFPHLDLNGKFDEGFDAIYYPTKRGIRQATYRAYIQPVRHRKSLLIRKFSHVTKILLREGSNDAYGVIYERHGSIKKAFANKEVILSAGTFGSPKLLMLSGIGPKNILETAGVHTCVDSGAVGKNLHDHVATLVGPFFTKSKKTFSYDDDVTPRSFIQFATRGTGPLTTSGFQATALLSSAAAKIKGQTGWPDIQLTLFGVTPHRLFSSDMAHAFGLDERIIQRYFLHARRKNAFFIIVSVARPESRGQLCIQSGDPHDPLVIVPKYYTDIENKDMRVMIEGIHTALYLAENTTEFINLHTHFTHKQFPGCEKFPFRSDGYWECYARHLSITLNDHVGTAQMGYSHSPYAVVDSELNVMGARNLRVVDASVMPTIVGANTQAATIMIAEKASEFILGRWRFDSYNYDLSRTSTPSNDIKYGPPQDNNVKYGPPPIPNTAYGAPGARPVPDDSIGQLLPPGPIPATYDSFDILRKDLERLDDSATTSPVPGFPVSTSPSYTDSFSGSSKLDSSVSGSSASTTLHPDTPTSPLTPVEGSSSPAALTDNVSSSKSPNDQFPAIYREVYDPSTPPPSDVLSRGSKNLDLSEISTTTPQTNSVTVTTMVKGPTGSMAILRKRKKLRRPPNVTVNPRGHLGFEDRYRTSNTISSTTPSQTSTSVNPLPKDYVVIKRRRPGRRRKVKRKKVTSLPKTSSTERSSTIFPTQKVPINTSKSVSNVLARLRNFIPPTSRSKRADLAISRRDVNIDDDNVLNRQRREKMEDVDMVFQPLGENQNEWLMQVETQLISKRTNSNVSRSLEGLDLNSFRRADDIENIQVDDLDTAASKTYTTDFDYEEEDGEEELVILNSINLHDGRKVMEMLDSDNMVVETNEASKTTNTTLTMKIMSMMSKEETEPETEHPMIPLDMNPIPRIMTTGNQSMESLIFSQASVTGTPETDNLNITSSEAGTNDNVEKYANSVTQAPNYPGTKNLTNDESKALDVNKHESSLYNVSYNQLEGPNNRNLNLKGAFSILNDTGQDNRTSLVEEKSILTPISLPGVLQNPGVSLNYTSHLTNTSSAPEVSVRSRLLNLTLRTSSETKKDESIRTSRRENISRSRKPNRKNHTTRNRHIMDKFIRPWSQTMTKNL